MPNKSYSVFALISTNMVKIKQLFFMFKITRQIQLQKQKQQIISRHQIELLQLKEVKSKPEQRLHVMEPTTLSSKIWTYHTLCEKFWSDFHILPVENKRTDKVSFGKHSRNFILVNKFPKVISRESIVHELRMFTSQKNLPQFVPCCQMYCHEQNDMSWMHSTLSQSGKWISKDDIHLFS